MASGNNSLQPSCWECGDTGTVPTGTVDAGNEVVVTDVPCSCGASGR